MNKKATHYYIMIVSIVALVAIVVLFQHVPNSGSLTGDVPLKLVSAKKQSPFTASSSKKTPHGRVCERLGSLQCRGRVPDSKWNCNKRECSCNNNCQFTNGTLCVYTADDCRGRTPGTTWNCQGRECTCNQNCQVSRSRTCVTTGTVCYNHIPGETWNCGPDGARSNIRCSCTAACQYHLECTTQGCEGRDPRQVWRCDGGTCSCNERCVFSRETRRESSSQPPQTQTYPSKTGENPLQPETLEHYTS